MNSEYWGRHFWKMLNCTVLNFPLEPTDENRNTYKQFFIYTSKIMPCKFCRQSLTIYMKYFPIDKYLDDRMGICYWLWTIHSLINSKLCKPNISFKQFIKKNEIYRARCGTAIIKDENNKNKKIKTCRKPSSNESNDINIFIDRAINKYKKMTDNLFSVFDKALDNPNKGPKKYLLKKNL